MQEKFSKIFSLVAHFGATQRFFAPIGERVVTYHCKQNARACPKVCGKKGLGEDAPLGVRCPLAPPLGELPKRWRG